MPPDGTPLTKSADKLRGVSIPSKAFNQLTTRSVAPQLATDLRGCYLTGRQLKDLDYASGTLLEHNVATSQINSHIKQTHSEGYTPPLE